jgi:hypothetical protein
VKYNTRKRARSSTYEVGFEIKKNIGSENGDGTHPKSAYFKKYK